MTKLWETFSLATLCMQCGALHVHVYDAYMYTLASAVWITDRESPKCTCTSGILC